MDFMVTNEDHDIHEELWKIYSSHYGSHVCLGCMVETLEKPELLPLQKKPIVTEMLRLLTHQTSEMIPVFMAEEMVVWHLLRVFMDNMKFDDRIFQAICTEAILRLTQLIGSDDLVTSIIDNISIQIEGSRDHNNMVPYYLLVGKLLYQLPGLAHRLVLEYSHLLDRFGEDLCSCGEKVQSELAYIFILLHPSQRFMSPRLLQNVHIGTLSLLTTAQREESQINGLGLLKKLIEDETGCQAIMSLKTDDHTVLTALKKLLLGKQHALQIQVAQVLLQLLIKCDGDQIGKAILDSDIAEFLFEGLHTNKTEQIHCIVKLLQRLACLDHFYKRCHAVYGIESVLRCLTTVEELKNLSLLEEGFHLMTEILQRQPPDIPLFVSQNVVKNCLKVIHSGIEIKQLSVSAAAQRSFTAMLRKDYLLSPVPFLDLGQCIISLSDVVQDKIKYIKRDGKKSFKRKTNGRSIDQDDLLYNFCEAIQKAATLAQKCSSDPTACESSFLPPTTVQKTPLSNLAVFVEQLFQLFDEVFIPVVVAYWNDIKLTEIYWKFIQLFSEFHQLSTSKSCDLVQKLVEVGFLGNLVDVTALHRGSMPSKYAAGITKFLQIAVVCFKDTEMLGCSKVRQQLICPEHLRWTMNGLGKGFMTQDVKPEEIESHLTLLYVSIRFGNRLLSDADLATVLSSVVEIHTSLEQLPPLTKRQYLFLLAWLSTHSQYDMWTSIPNGVKGLPTILNGPMENWYTDDIIMLLWCYMDPILAPVCGKKVLLSFLSFASIEQLQEKVEELMENIDAFYQLIQNHHFTRDLVNLTMDYWVSVDTNSGDSMLADKTGGHDEHQQLEEITQLIEETLQDAFLQKYSESKSHNILVLLELYLKVYRHSSTGNTFNKKILYHVLNLIKNESQQADDLQRVGVVAILAALSTRSDSQAVCMVVKQDHVLGYLENCIAEPCHPCYRIVCDIVADLIKQTGDIQVHRSISINIEKLSEQLLQKGMDTGCLRIVCALFECHLHSNLVTIQGTLSSSFYKSLTLTLQQMIVQDLEESSAEAVSCLLALFSHLSVCQENVYTEILNQPWNMVLLDVLLDIAMISQSGLKCHHTKLYSFFTKDKSVSELLSKVPGSFSKLVTLLTNKSTNDMDKNEDKNEEAQRKTLVVQLLSNCDMYLQVTEKDTLKLCIM